MNTKEMVSIKNEIERNNQEGFGWERQVHYDTYNRILGYYQVCSVLDYARGTTLLDMPCGDGYITGMLASKFKRTVGIDASKKRLDKCKNLYADVEFHHALIEEFTTDEKFDTITMLNILEHVNNPVEVLQKAESLLAPDGIIIVHVPNAHAVNRKIAKIMGTLESCEELSPFDINVAGHRRSYTMKTLHDEVVNAGLNVINGGGVFYKMLSTPQMDWFLANGLWEDGGFGWGRVGEEKSKNWKTEFCRACYEYGKLYPEDCNIVYVCAEKASLP
ncbi:MAG: class I SAM-dependent methyltransferase [Bacteroidales bacterium]|jgi:2-polyprenyl-3-methyl-5-hydroxy-6-metoxy-1,4-benzoquinol methylase|nr:class I SAM-dependent methyltransferase [Bacteroidales bacterium]